VSLSFLSPSRCEPETLASPLRRALERVGWSAYLVHPENVRDISLEGVVEVRGDLDRVAALDGEELVRLSPRRGFLFTGGDPADVVERVRAAGPRAYDATGALAGMAIADERLLARLTDLDLSQVPTAGPFARVWALFRRGEDGEYLVYVHQELGHYAAEAVVDALVGVEAPA
jgi:hypothetical protein